jgi:hypothetical protein
MSNLKLQALKARYQAKKLEAIAELENYMSNSAGIGEHPSIIYEMDKLVQKVADADGCLAAIDAVFTSSPEGNTETNAVNS